MNEFFRELREALGGAVSVLTGAEVSAKLPRIRLQALTESPRVFSDDGTYSVRGICQAGVYSISAEECEAITRSVLSALFGMGAFAESVRSADEKGVSGRVIRFYVNKEEL